MNILEPLRRPRNVVVDDDAYRRGWADFQRVDTKPFEETYDPEEAVLHHLIRVCVPGVGRIMLVDLALHFSLFVIDARDRGI